MARLTRQDWIDAAYTSFSESGIAAVAVEPVARALGATKGSFYWHFTDRRALVDAVLDLWRERETELLIREVERLGDPGEKLMRLFSMVSHRAPARSGERTLYADAAAAHVREPVQAATERRVSYVEALLRESGVTDAEARRRAVIVVATVVGFQQLVSSGWKSAVDPDALIETLYRIATAGS